MNIKIPVCELEISEESGTIWVHSARGATVLRIKCWGGIIVRQCEGAVDGAVSHMDLNVPAPTENNWVQAHAKVPVICLADDAVIG